MKKGVSWIFVFMVLVSVVSAIDIPWPSEVPLGEPFHTILYTDEIRPANSTVINIAGVIYGNGSGIYGLNLTNQYFGGDNVFDGDITTFINNVDVGGNLSVNESLNVSNYIYVGSLVGDYITVDKDIFTSNMGVTNNLNATNIYTEVINVTNIFNEELNAVNIYSQNISANYYCDKDGTDCYNITELVSGDVSSPGLFDVLGVDANASDFDGQTTFGGAMKLLGDVDFEGDYFTRWFGDNYIEINYDVGNDLFAIQSSKSIRISGAGNTNLSKLILKANEIDVGLICGDDETLTGKDGVLTCTEDLVNDSDNMIGNEYPTAGTGILINESTKVNVNESWLDDNYIGQNEYPNLDINSTNDLNDTTEFGGDVSGTYDNLQVKDNSHNLSWDNITGIPLDIKDGDDDTWWGLNEGYIYNSSNSLDFNESMLNATIDDRAGDVTDVWVNESGDTMTGPLKISDSNLFFTTNDRGIFWSSTVNTAEPHIETHSTDPTIYISAGANNQEPIPGSKVYLEGETTEVSGNLTVGGNMGIGNANPQALLTLDDGVDSRMYFDLPDWSYGTINVRNDADSASRDLALQNQGGNVGIGTSNVADNKLVVQGGITTSDGTDQGKIHFRHDRDDTKIYENADHKIHIDAPSGIDLNIDSNGNNNEKLRIMSGTTEIAYIQEPGNMQLDGDLTVSGGEILTPDSVMPNIVLNSVGSGDNWNSQGAYISIGESGDLGAAALHMTYRGDGYGWIGSGAVSNAVPGASYLRFDYNSDNIYTPDNLRVDGEIRQGSSDYGGYEIQTGGQIYTNDYLVAMGGVHIGGTSDPGTDNLVVDGNIYLSEDMDQIRFTYGDDDWYWMSKPGSGLAFAVYSPNE
ncbi:hypothetical protein ISS04_03165, partial [Candidatus Woesearchaeota archaeon]|nr:hypothetical protein [Candidatus Woesearchaeota archaeon]